MAGGAIIGALQVVLGADTAALDKGLKDSQSGIAAWGKQIATVAAGIGIEKIVENLVYGLKKAVTQGIETADQLNKMSQSAGLSVESLSKLSYAAELSDVSTEALGKSMGKLSKAMVSAATDGAGAAAQAFNSMGVSVKNNDGTLRSSGDVLADVADKFSGYKDSAEKTTLAMSLFGKAGAALIPLLNLGKEGLAEAGDEAEKFGLVIDKKTAVAAENFNDNLKRLDKIKQGLVMTITAQLLPTFEHYSEVLLEAKKNSSLMNDVANGLVAGFKFVVAETAQAVLSFQRLGAEASALWKVLNAPWGEIGKAWEAYQAEGKKTEQMFGSLKQSLESALNPSAASFDWTGQLIGVKSMQKEVAILGAEWGKTNAPIVASGEASKNAVQKFLESSAKRTAGMLAEAATVGLATGALEKLKIMKEGEALADANKIAKTPALIASITAAGDAAANAALKIQAAQAVQQVMSPAEKYAQDLANLQQVYQSTDMTMATFQARQQQLAEGVGATWEQAASQGANGFAQLATQFGKNSQEMAVAAKTFGIIEATINTYTAFTKALASAPPPFNYVMAAGVLAAGMAKVAAIKSQSTGMMTGGSMTVRGSGGPDSVPVNMMLSPGEQIDVWRPDQGGGSDPRRGAGGGNVVNLSVPIVTTRDALRELIDRLNGMFSDGYRLNLQPV
ncbi:hypothetical protein [Tardiphaga sp. 862_B3_N1_1]|uniref:hypothetical protein n=1 Tax=Tardiphaga sp. 862_B3_N1_1 TaxID=3240763 RepID=UPI003F8BEF2C